MADGGRFPWRRQRVQRVPTTNYRNMRLPDRPPSGLEWTKDPQTREWSLQPITTSKFVQAEQVVNDDASTAIPLAEAVPISSDKTEAVAVATEFRLHRVRESEDTFEGICLRYMVTPTELRRANGIVSGTSLRLAPSILRIPVKFMTAKAVPLNDQEEKQMEMAKRCPDLSRNEISAYLEMNEWNLEAALAEATKDSAAFKKAESEK